MKAIGIFSVILPDEVELGKFNSVSLWKALADLGIALQVILSSQCF